MSPQVSALSTNQKAESAQSSCVLGLHPSATSRATRQSQSGSITITQQLCVFAEDYIFKRTLGGGVRKVVWQTMEVLTQGCRKQRPSPPVTLLCGKINPHNKDHHGWLCCCHLLSIPLVFFLSPLLSAKPFSFPSCQGTGREACCQVQIIQQKAKYWHRMICLVRCSWIVHITIILK